jgi:hypothetical protein
MVYELITLVVGLSGGIFGAYLYFKFKEIDKSIAVLHKRISDIENLIPSSEEIAREILNMKIPVSTLPPELQEQFRTSMPSGIQSKNPIVG